jgi:hypothetical protein
MESQDRELELELFLSQLPDLPLQLLQPLLQSCRIHPSKVALYVVVYVVQMAQLHVLLDMKLGHLNDVSGHV